VELASPKARVAKRSLTGKTRCSFLSKDLFFVFGQAQKNQEREAELASERYMWSYRKYPDRLLSFFFLARKCQHHFPECSSGHHFPTQSVSPPAEGRLASRDDVLPEEL